VQQAWRKPAPLDRSRQERNLSTHPRSPALAPRSGQRTLETPDPGGEARAIRIAAWAFFTGIRAGTGALLGVAAVRSDFAFAGHVRAAGCFLSFLMLPSSTTLCSTTSFLARRGLGIFFCTGRPSSSTTLPSMRRSVVRRRTAPNSPRYCAMRANAPIAPDF